MEEQRRFSRGRFLCLSAMMAGGAVLAGCNLEEGGGPPGTKKGGGGGEDVDFGKIQAGESPDLEKLAEDWRPYDGEPVEISVWMYTPDQRSLNAYKRVFEKKADATGEFGGSVILQQNDQWEGTGHNSVVRDEAGRDWIFYHAIDPDDRYNPGTEAPKRPMLMDQIVYRSGWPEIEEPSPSTNERQGPLVH
jgi:hypothetical protein